MNSVGNLTAENTSVIVTRPASGMPAAPMDAITDVSTTSSCSVNESSTPSSW